MKQAFKIGLVIGALAMFSATLAPMLVHAQFPNQHPDGVQMPASSEASKDRVGGPVAVGQQMLQSQCTGAGCSTSAPPVALVQSAPPSGGIIQLSAFGWLEPYVDSILQALIAAGIAWLGKSKYSQWLDQSARDALETFAKNSASSLLADGVVAMRGKTVTVDSVALARAADEASKRIPDALKRFGITPQLVADKIVDAIPQTAAGAQIVANAHEEPIALVVPPKAGLEPPTSAS